MNELEKIEILLKMLILLSSGGKFSLSQQSVHRHISLLREVGFIIPRPADKLYFIKNSSLKFKEMSQLLHFSEEEAFILSKAIHFIDNENLLKQNLVNKLYALYDFDRVAKIIVKKEYSESIHQLTQAIRLKNKVILKEYLSANSNEARDRLVEPFDFTTNYIATWAYDIDDGSCKTFKNTRIKSVQILSEPWRFEENHKKKPIDVFRNGSDRQIEVTLKLSIRACELLKEEYPLAEKYNQQVNVNEFRFTAPVRGIKGVARFVMGLYDEIEVIGPDELKKYLKNKAEKILTDTD